MPSTTMSTTTTMIPVTPTPIPGAPSFLHTYNPTYTPSHRYSPIYKPLPTNYTTHKPPHYYTHYDHSFEKIPFPTLFYPKKKEVPVYEEEEVFSSDDVLGKKVAPKGRNWCRNHNSICSVLYILGCGFPVSFEFPPLPSKPSSVCLATEFALTKQKIS